MQTSQSPLKSYLHIPCVFPVQLEIFPVSISETHFEKKLKFRNKWRNILYLYNQGIYYLSKRNCLCFGKNSKLPVFSLTGMFAPFTLFSSGVPDQYIVVTEN